MGLNDKLLRRNKRKARVRGKISGTQSRPRLTITRTLKYTYAQVIDDEKMVTLASASSLNKEIAAKLTGKTKTEGAAIVGEAVARLAIEKGVKKVAFDRNGKLYHGRVKALADAARKAGLEF
jgi:large subunit ribosomal protein L18